MDGRFRDSGESTGDHDRPGVFRRPTGDEEGFERMYRSSGSRRNRGESRQGAGRTGERSRDRPPSGSRSRSRVYGGSGDQRRMREQRRRRRRTILVTLFVVLLVVPGLLYLWLDSRLERVEALADYEGRPDSRSGTTYMVVGSDSRDGLSEEEIRELATGADDGAQLADSIMVLYVPNSGDPTLVSVPRDSLVEVEGQGQQKINASYAFGGPELLARTFERESGVQIDHYVEIGFAGFVGIVDAIGGVELCPEEAMQDPLAGLDIEAGCQNMDGGTALGYVRTRATPRADLDRVERQREFFGALMNEVTSPGVMFNPFRGLPLALETTDTFDVDESDRLRHLMAMALAMRSDLETSAIPVADTPTLPGLGSVVRWDEARSEQMFEAMRNGDPIPEEAMMD